MKGLNFTFFGGATKFTPEEYFKLFKLYPEVEISGPVHYGQVSRAQHLLVESHLQTIIK
jgi:hypothetical protein